MVDAAAALSPRALNSEDFDSDINFRETMATESLSTVSMWFDANESENALTTSGVVLDISPPASANRQRQRDTGNRVTTLPSIPTQGLGRVARSPPIPTMRQFQGNTERAETPSRIAASRQYREVAMRQLEEVQGGLGTPVTDRGSLVKVVYRPSSPNNQCSGERVPLAPSPPVHALRHPARENIRAKWPSSPARDTIPVVANRVESPVIPTLNRERLNTKYCPLPPIDDSKGDSSSVPSLDLERLAKEPEKQRNAAFSSQGEGQHEEQSVMEFKSNSPPIPALLNKGRPKYPPGFDDEVCIGFGVDENDIPHWERTPRSGPSPVSTDRGRPTVRTNRAQLLRRDKIGSSAREAARQRGNKTSVSARERNACGKEDQSASSKVDDYFSSTRRTESPPVPAFRNRRQDDVQEGTSPEPEVVPFVSTSPPVPALMNKSPRQEDDSIVSVRSVDDEDLPHWERPPKEPTVPTGAQERGRLRIRTNKTLEMRRNMNLENKESMDRQVKKPRRASRPQGIYQTEPSKKLSSRKPNATGFSISPPLRGPPCHDAKQISRRSKPEEIYDDDDDDCRYNNRDDQPRSWREEEQFQTDNESYRNDTYDDMMPPGNQYAQQWYHNVPPPKATPKKKKRLLVRNTRTQNIRKQNAYKIMNPDDPPWLKKKKNLQAKIAMANAFKAKVSNKARVNPNDMDSPRQAYYGEGPENFQRPPQAYRQDPYQYPGPPDDSGYVEQDTFRSRDSHLSEEQEFQNESMMDQPNSGRSDESNAFKRAPRHIQDPQTREMNDITEERQIQSDPNDNGDFREYDGEDSQVTENKVFDERQAVDAVPCNDNRRRGYEAFEINIDTDESRRPEQNIPTRPNVGGRPRQSQPQKPQKKRLVVRSTRTQNIRRQVAEKIMHPDDPPWLVKKKNLQAKIAMANAFKAKAIGRGAPMRNGNNAQGPVQSVRERYPVYEAVPEQEEFEENETERSDAYYGNEVERGEPSQRSVEGYDDTAETARGTTRYNGQDGELVDDSIMKIPHPKNEINEKGYAEDDSSYPESIPADDRRHGFEAFDISFDTDGRHNQGRIIPPPRRDGVSGNYIPAPPQEPKPKKKRLLVRNTRTQNIRRQVAEKIMNPEDPPWMVKKKNLQAKIAMANAFKAKALDGRVACERNGNKPQGPAQTTRYPVNIHGRVSEDDEPFGQVDNGSCPSDDHEYAPEDDQVSGEKRTEYIESYRNYDEYLEAGKFIEDPDGKKGVITNRSEEMDKEYDGTVSDTAESTQNTQRSFNQEYSPEAAEGETNLPRSWSNGGVAFAISPPPVCKEKTNLPGKEEVGNKAETVKLPKVPKKDTKPEPPRNKKVVVRTTRAQELRLKALQATMDQEDTPRSPWQSPRKGITPRNGSSSSRSTGGNTSRNLPALGKASGQPAKENIPATQRTARSILRDDGRDVPTDVYRSMFNKKQVIGNGKPSDIGKENTSTPRSNCSTISPRSLKGGDTEDENFSADITSVKVGVSHNRGHILPQIGGRSKPGHDIEVKTPVGSSKMEALRNGLHMKNAVLPNKPVICKMDREKEPESPEKSILASMYASPTPRSDDEVHMKAEGEGKMLDDLDVEEHEPYVKRKSTYEESEADRQEILRNLTLHWINLAEEYYQERSKREQQLEAEKAKEAEACVEAVSFRLEIQQKLAEARQREINQLKEFNGRPLVIQQLRERHLQQKSDSKDMYVLLPKGEYAETGPGFPCKGYRPMVGDCYPRDRQRSIDEQYASYSLVYGLSYVSRSVKPCMLRRQETRGRKQFQLAVFEGNVYSCRTTGFTRVFSKIPENPRLHAANEIMTILTHHFINIASKIEGNKPGKNGTITPVDTLSAQKNIVSDGGINDPRQNKSAILGGSRDNTCIKTTKSADSAVGGGGGALPSPPKTDKPARAGSDFRRFRAATQPLPMEGQSVPYINSDSSTWQQEPVAGPSNAGEGKIDTVSTVKGSSINTKLHATYSASTTTQDAHSPVPPTRIPAPTYSYTHANSRRCRFDEEEEEEEIDDSVWRQPTRIPAPTQSYLCASDRRYRGLDEL